MDQWLFFSPDANEVGHRTTELAEYQTRQQILKNVTNSLKGEEIRRRWKLFQRWNRSDYKNRARTKAENVTEHTEFGKQ